MKPIYTKNRTIGLLGGSFNPAHSGHLHLSLYALKKLGIDEVWWLVSPHNPLKEKASLEGYAARLASAKAAARHTHIYVSDIEARIGTRYSYQTLTWLKRRYPGTRFVWLMGADNLVSFHRWRRWQYLLATTSFIVFDRAPYSHSALRSKAYQWSRQFLLKNTDLKGDYTAPGLHFVHLRRDANSSTALRKKLGKGAFLRHTENAGRT